MDRVTEWLSRWELDSKLRERVEMYRMESTSVSLRVALELCGIAEDDTFWLKDVSRKPYEMPNDFYSLKAKPPKEKLLNALVTRIEIYNNSFCFRL